MTSCGLIGGYKSLGEMVAVLKMETVRSSETRVTSYQTTQCHDSEDQHLYLRPDIGGCLRYYFFSEIILIIAGCYLMLAL